MSYPVWMHAARHAGVGLAACLLLLGCTPRVELLSKLSDNDANAVVGALLAADIEAYKVSQKGGISVEVAAKQMQSAIDLLDHAGLPRVPRSRIGEVFKKESLVSSPLEERARYLYALSQELEDTLLNIDGVIAARVQVVLPERVTLGEPLSLSSASVFIKHRPEMSFEGLIPKITNLVSTSIPGLADKKVSVVLVPARLNPAPAPPPELGRVLFFQVHRDSVAGLIALLAVLAGALAFAGIAVSWMGWRFREPLRAALAPWLAGLLRGASPK